MFSTWALNSRNIFRLADICFPHFLTVTSETATTKPLRNKMCFISKWTLPFFAFVANVTRNNGVLPHRKKGFQRLNKIELLTTLNMDLSENRQIHMPNYLATRIPEKRIPFEIIMKYMKSSSQPATPVENIFVSEKYSLRLTCLKIDILQAAFEESWSI